MTRNNRLGSSEIEYLEEFLIRKAVEAGNDRVDNANKGCGEEPQVGQDYRFISPSGAAALVFGTNAKGWRTWKVAAGKTLDERIRKNEG